jgi:hypothetical protein
MLVPPSLVLQQNAYLLFYRKRYVPTETELAERKVMQVRLASLP